ncbi:hypothetical protein [Dinghuibacter silviterrae]|nr:hypothetical protein [Dinghuibacter silviterrae]
MISLLLPVAAVAAAWLMRTNEPSGGRSPALWFLGGALVLLTGHFIIIDGPPGIHVYSSLWTVARPSFWVLISWIDGPFWFLFLCLVYLLFPRVFHKNLTEWMGHVHFGLTFMAAAYLWYARYYALGAHSIVPGWHLVIFTEEEQQAGRIVGILLLSAQLLLPVNLLRPKKAPRETQAKADFSNI